MGLHHHLHHLTLVSKEDVPRFKQLDIIAGFSPAIWYPCAFTDLGYPLFGKERMEHRWYPIKEFVDAGGINSYGTDWPIADGPSPWPQMEGMITRKDPYGKRPEKLGESITVAQAIKIFTLGGAQTVMQEKLNGSIEEGKYADMIVLDRNLLEIPEADINGTVVLNTIFEGKSVYKKQ